MKIINRLLTIIIILITIVPAVLAALIISLVAYIAHGVNVLPNLMVYYFEILVKI